MSPTSLPAQAMLGAAKFCWSSRTFLTAPDCRQGLAEHTVGQMCLWRPLGRAWRWVMRLYLGHCEVGQQSWLPEAIQVQESWEGVHRIGNLTTTQEAASPHVCSVVCHVPNDPTSHAEKPSFQLSVSHWKSVQTAFKNITEISSKDKSTLRERTNITHCKREKIQIRCRETKSDSLLNSLPV